MSSCIPTRSVNQSAHSSPNDSTSHHFLSEFPQNLTLSNAFSVMHQSNAKLKFEWTYTSALVYHLSPRICNPFSHSFLRPFASIFKPPFSPPLTFLDKLEQHWFRLVLMTESGRRSFRLSSRRYRYRIRSCQWDHRSRSCPRKKLLIGTSHFSVSSSLFKWARLRYQTWSCTFQKIYSKHRYQLSSSLQNSFRALWVSTLLFPRISVTMCIVFTVFLSSPDFFV